MQGEKILKELQIQNLLSVIDIRARCDGPLDGTKAGNVLNYIFNHEMNNLQLDCLFKEDKKEDIPPDPLINPFYHNGHYTD